MDTYALLGHPLAHSFSAGYFADKFSREGIDAIYVNLDLPSLDLLPSALKQYHSLKGFNVTIPYKQAIIPFLDEIDPVAAAIGAVNTVRVCRAHGRMRLCGFNTDAPGFLKSLGRMSGSLSGRALLLGNGGAAAAVRYALTRSGVECTVVSRAAAHGVLTYERLDSSLLREHKYIVNCTPLGTYPRSHEAPPIPYALITPEHICHDLVYNPGCTRFMALCAERGAVVCNGLAMLHNQAELSWRIWQGEDAGNGGYL